MLYTYEQFIHEVADRVAEKLSQNTKVVTCQTRKNNGVMKRGICISQESGKASPTIYLEEFYEKYRNGKFVDAIVRDVVELYSKVKNRAPDVEMILDSFSAVSERIIYRLVNWEYNQELLETVPHVRYLNLAVLFYVIIDTDTYANASMLITDEHAQIWDVGTEELLECAGRNTRKLLGTSFQPMEKVLEELTAQTFDLENILYVLSNKERFFGAATMMFQDLLAEIADYFRENYYILPCSVHELILVKESFAMPDDELIRMVKEINEEAVLPEEILSNSIYLYNAKEGTILVMS